MLIEGKDNIKATRAKVWKFLTDAESVSKCMPGVESTEIIEPGKKFKALGAVRLGTVKLKVDTTIEWVELKKPDRAKMKMTGTAPGSSIDVGSEIELVDGPKGSTDLIWKAEVNVVGAIASLAARLMKPVTAKMTAQFFSCLKKNIEA